MLYFYFKANISERWCFKFEMIHRWCFFWSFCGVFFGSAIVGDEVILLDDYLQLLESSRSQSKCHA